MWRENYMPRMLGTKESESQDQFQETKEWAKRRAQETAEMKADQAKREFGRMAFNALEEHFPEQATAQRDQNRLQYIGAGIAIGFLLRHLLGRRS